MKKKKKFNSNIKREWIININRKNSIILSNSSGNNIIYYYLFKNINLINNE